jgi:hypothetical protein
MKIFQNLDKYWQRYKSNILYSGLDEKKKTGKIRPFDEKFYSSLDGMYYNGIPVYYYLMRMNMGKCYDCSAILGLALGDCKICRGNLRKAPTTSGNNFGHGWVEKDGLVYDTTWQIITDKHTYYKLFGASGVSARDSKQFFEECKGMSSWEIHDKKYYEENYIPMDSLLIFQVRELEKIHLNSPVSPISTKEDKIIAKMVLDDLPNVEPKSSLDMIYENEKQ